MVHTVGMVEFTSIARGCSAVDSMLKAADVTLLKAHSLCPGKYMGMVTGDIAAVQEAVDVACLIGQETVVDRLVLSNLHPQVIPAITGTTHIKKKDAVGILEFFSVATAVTAADLAAKAADIELIEVRLGFAIGGKALVLFTGEVSAVDAALEAGAKAAKENGLLVEKTVIPRPHPAFFDTLF